MGYRNALVFASLAFMAPPWLAPVHAETPVQSADAATTQLAAARVSYQAKNYPAAAEQFRNFIKANDKHAEINAARMGLAMALLEMPEKDYAGAIEALKPAAAAAGFADHAKAVYFMGFASRGLGNQSLVQASAKPAEAQKLRDVAIQKHEEAAGHFAAAAAAFAADPEWAARAKCDQGEMLLRLSKYKETVALLEPLLHDAAVAKGRHFKLSAYLHGYACYALKDHQTAGRSLSLLAPFDEPAVGLHARYLLARIHQEAGERPEAAGHYGAILAGYDSTRRAAAEAIRNADAFKDRPDEKYRLEQVAKETPDYLSRSAFYLGVLFQEQGHFAEAIVKLQPFLQQNPQSPLAAEAQLRLAICRVEMKNGSEAVRLLTPLQEHPQLGDQVLRWMGKAHLANADPGNAPAFNQEMAAAITALTKAAEKAKQAAAVDPDAKARRGEILMELADAQQMARKYKEAAAAYELLITEGYAGAAEAALQGQAISLHLVGLYKESDDLCQKFLTTYPRSVLAPNVLYHSAQNAFHLAAANAAEQARLRGEAIARYKKLVATYPEFEQISLARHGLANVHYVMGQYAEAAGALAGIPDAERIGELGAVAYLQADCLLRTLPKDADDAISAARLIEQVEQAQKLLNGFINANEASPQGPDAMIKLANSYQRVAAAMADADERRNNLKAAREVYHRFVQRFPGNPLFAVALHENSRVLAQLGDVGTAVNQLSRFQSPPLNKASNAPLALVHMAEYLRQQKKPAEAAKALTDARAQYEADLLKDAARAEWVPQLHYQLALALNESGKFPEARALFESIAKQFPDRPQASEAAWRIGQSRKDEALAKIAEAHKALAAAANPAAQTAIDQGMKSATEAAEYLQAQAKKMGDKGGETALRMMHEAALCYGSLSQWEMAAAREKMQQEAVKSLKEKVAKQYPAGYRPPSVRAPEIAAAAIPVQPSEQKARQQYQALIAAAGDSPLANEARLELAELLARHGENDGAIALLRQALSADPTPEVSDKIAMNMAKALLAKGDAKGAATRYEAILKNPRSPAVQQARVGLGEALIAQKEYAKAIEHLQLYRQVNELKAIPEISDRAVLLLSQAYVQSGQWDAAKTAIDAFMRRYPQSPWMLEAKYTQGLVQLHTKQYAEALAAFRDVATRAVGELSAKAQLQIGRTLLEQKQFGEAADALLTVPFAYDYPELSAAALCDAALALKEVNKKQEAAALLQRVVTDNPTGRWADLARKLLAEIK
jgi:TolA-binding protein